MGPLTKGAAPHAWYLNRMVSLVFAAVLFAAKADPATRVRIVQVPNAGEAAEARITSDGAIHLFYQLQGTPYYVKSADGGTPGRSGMRTGVAALQAADGVSLVAWRHEDEVGWQLYSEDGKPLGAPGSIQSPGKGVAAVVDREGRFLLLQ